ncbi:MAG: DUF6115 domain-containing protein [Bacillota bacterium]
MGWWLLLFGIVLLTGGIIIKIKEYEDFGDYKDFQNLTTKTRYLKEETNKFNNKDKNKTIAKKKNIANKNKNSGNSSDSIDKVIEDAENKEKQLRKINNELDEIITEIHSKEERIKNILEESKKEDMEISEKQNFKKLLKKSTKKIEGKELPEKHRKIFELYNQGHKEEEIADELNIGIRETSLILKMHKRGAAND